MRAYKYTARVSRGFLTRLRRRAEVARVMSVVPFYTRNEEKEVAAPHDITKSFYNVSFFILPRLSLRCQRETEKQRKEDTERLREGRRKIRKTKTTSTSATTRPRSDKALLQNVRFTFDSKKENSAGELKFFCPEVRSAELYIPLFLFSPRRSRLSF